MKILFEHEIVSDLFGNQSTGVLSVSVYGFREGNRSTGWIIDGDHEDLHDKINPYL
jgi:hypothetical protein